MWKWRNTIVGVLAVATMAGCQKQAGDTSDAAATLTRINRHSKIGTGQVEVILNPAKREQAMALACTLLSEKCLRKAAEAAGTQGTAEVRDWEVLRSRVKVAVLGEGQTGLVSLSVGDCASVAQARAVGECLAKAGGDMHAESCRRMYDEQVSLLSEELQSLNTKVEAAERNRRDSSGSGHPRRGTNRGVDGGQTQNPAERDVGWRYAGRGDHEEAGRHQEGPPEQGLW